MERIRHAKRHLEVDDKTVRVAAQGCLPPGENVCVAAPPPNQIGNNDILMVTTTALVWTVTNSTLSWGGGVIT